jgi:hypothetical protein
MIRSSAAFQEHFEALTAKAFAALGAGQILACELIAEDSQFVRLNAAKVRQAGQVQDATLRLKLFVQTTDGIRNGEASISLTGEESEDFSPKLLVIPYKSIGSCELFSEYHPDLPE